MSTVDVDSSDGRAQGLPAGCGRPRDRPVLWRGIERGIRSLPRCGRDRPRQEHRRTRGDRARHRAPAGRRSRRPDRHRLRVQQHRPRHAEPAPAQCHRRQAHRHGDPPHSAGEGKPPTVGEDSGCREEGESRLVHPRHVVQRGRMASGLRARAGNAHGHPRQDRQSDRFGPTRDPPAHARHGEDRQALRPVVCPAAARASSPANPTRESSRPSPE